MVYQIDLPFNVKPSTIMHIDLNSCFATIEQQANPHLRGKPVAVAAYDSPGGCILAPSVEAKRLGIKVGMRVKEGRLLYPGLVVMLPDANKYRNVHLKLKNLLSNYTQKLIPKSIDEFVMDLEGYPAYSKGMFGLGKEIKARIRQEVGEWLTVSVGIGPNRFLAKMAAGLKKPDGLDEISVSNYETTYDGLELTDLTGIARQNSARLNASGIHTVKDMYEASLAKLWGAFHSINAYDWYLRLRGWEADDVDWGRKSFGNSYALPKPYQTVGELTPILSKLVEKMCFRLRKNGFACQGVHYAVSFRDGTHWHRGMKTEESFSASSDIYKKIFKLFTKCPYKKPVRIMAVSVFNLISKNSLQLNLFTDNVKKDSLYEALDMINERWGNYVMTPARMLNTSNNVTDRISFGGVKELENFVIS